MSWQEPSRNPQEEPSHGAREATVSQKDLVGFDQVIAAYPRDGQARTDWPMARSAFARACELVTAEQLLAAVRRYAAEGRFGDFGSPAFERWLQREGWRPWLSEVGAEARPSLAVVRQWGGPAELRAAIVADPVLGEAWARSYLDGASWFGAERLIVPASHFAGAKLRREAGGHLRTYEISVGGPERPAATGGL